MEDDIGLPPSCSQIKSTKNAEAKSMKLTPESLFTANQLRFTFPPRNDAAFHETLVASELEIRLSENVIIQTDKTDEVRILGFTDVRSHFGADENSTFIAVERFVRSCSQPSDMNVNCSCITFIMVSPNPIK